jgi:hypothetical protein
MPVAGGAGSPPVAPRRTHTDFVFSSRFEAAWTKKGHRVHGRVRFFPAAMPPSSFSRAVGGILLGALALPVASGALKRGRREAKPPQHDPTCRDPEPSSSGPADARLFRNRLGECRRGDRDQHCCAGNQNGLHDINLFVCLRMHPSRADHFSELTAAWRRNGTARRGRRRLSGDDQGSTARALQPGL